VGRASSTPGALAGAATAAALIAHQVAGKAVRDALFLSSFPSSSLPLMMAAAAAVSIAAVLWLSRSMARHPPASLVPVLFAASAFALVLEWAVGLVSPSVSAVAVYMHTTALGPALISLFWSLVNERFDPSSAKPAVAKIAAGGTIGGVLGALAAWRAASLVSLSALVLFLAALHGTCVVGASLLRRPATSPPEATVDPDPAESPSAFQLLRTTPMLRHLGLLVAFGAATSALLDYVFAAQAAVVFGSGAPLLGFFAMFWLVVSVVSFVLQLTLGRLAMERLGLAANVAALPALTVLAGVLGIAAPGLTSTSILRGTEAAHRNTLFRSAYEALYTPLTKGLKRTTKALIDVGFDRLGTVLGSGVAMVAVALYAEQAPPLLIVAVIVLALATLPVAGRLHLGYVGALEQGLRDGAERADLGSLGHGSNRATVELNESVQRETLIERVEALRPGGLGELAATESAPPGPASQALRDPQPLFAQGRELLSGDVERARRALTAWPGSGKPVADFAIVLLAHPTLHREATQALGRIARQVTGELVDALLDPTMDFVVRRRIPRVLVACGSQRAADGLVAGIADERFEVRHACGRALLEMKQGNAEITISRERVIEAILLEREKSKESAKLALELDVDAADDGPESLAYLLVRDRIDRSLEHVFTILSLHLEREPLRMAFRALHHDDVHYRGTALEYLSTVLPAEIRDAVWPLLGDTGPLPEGRPAQDILADLVRSTSPDARGA
jgi:ATP:ADP antiporter, AAA family